MLIMDILGKTFSVDKNMESLLVVEYDVGQPDDLTGIVGRNIF